MADVKNKSAMLCTFTCSECGMTTKWTAGQISSALRPDSGWFEKMGWEADDAFAKGKHECRQENKAESDAEDLNQTADDLVKAVDLLVPTNAKLLDMVDTLLGTGLWGRSMGEVAERLIAERLEQIARQGEWLIMPEM